MGELASVGKLHEYFTGDGMRHDVIHKLIDDVEREVSERFMLLPVDADGVPIHLDDRLWIVNDYPFYVHSIVVEKDKAFVKTNTNSMSIVTYKTDKCHHVNLRTIEDVLTDYAASSLTLEEAAIELRGMMEADDD